MKPHILVVDDEAPIRELLTTYFQSRGYQVTAAATADEAIRRTADASLNLVLLDLVLSDADGLELLGTLKKSHPDLPVIIMTGMGSDESLLKQATDNGAAGFVSKTLPLDKLRAEVESKLRRG
ncbi:MAG: response regulator [Verrucomicrobia bacterium]|nr:response regulator [Verrucomicrobiota bacterium]